MNATEKFTETNFKKWLAKQPLDREFCYTSNDSCLFASFAKEKLKLKKVHCMTFELIHSKGTIPFPAWAARLDARIVLLVGYFKVSEVTELI